MSCGSYKQGGFGGEQGTHALELISYNFVPFRFLATCTRDAEKRWSKMGVVYVEGTVTGPTGKQATVNFLVDSGAMYTLVPRKVWRAIGLKPMDSIKCFLADGTGVERKVSECRISLPQGQRSTPVLLGEKDDEALLGAVTLEELRLVLNPFTRQLQPMRMMLA